MAAIERCTVGNGISLDLSMRRQNASVDLTIFTAPSPSRGRKLKMTDDNPFKKSKASKETKKAVFESVVDDDMPDGAYFAMAEEFGLEPEDLVSEPRSEK
jgi:hypothetical protein